MVSTSLARQTKDAAIMSMPCSMPKRMSARSFSPMEGICRSTSGTEMPLRLPSTPPLTTQQTMSVPLSTRSTFMASRPSSMSTRVPGPTSSAMRG